MPKSSREEASGRCGPVRDDAGGARGRFLETTLQYPEGTFDAVLMWDILDYLDNDLMTKLAARMTSLVRDGGVVFAIFHARKPERLPSLPRPGRAESGIDSRILPIRSATRFSKPRNFKSVLAGIDLPRRSWGAISFAKAFSSSKLRHRISCTYPPADK